MEAELEQLRGEIDRLRSLAEQAQAEADRRTPRRDLVPLRQAVSLYRR
jgi:hypothetical protein